MPFPTDWTQSLAQAFRTSSELSAALGWRLPEGVSARYPLLVPKRLAALIQAAGPDSALARQFLPHVDELSELGLDDPIGDQAFAKTAQLIHRYDNRALVIPTTKCPVNCRYCFRKNELGSDTPFAQEREATLNYLVAHPEIEEVIFTGGDPLVLSDEKLEGWLAALAQIPSIRWVRFHTRVPVILPERLTSRLWSILDQHSGRFERFLMVVHTNHQDEWDAETREAVRNFAHPRLEWMSQTVLLKAVNDCESALVGLFRQLVEDGIRPYYLHHPDRVRGGMHFWLELEEGRALYGKLRRQLPGWALPQYVIDIPGGHGKTLAYNPERLDFSGQLIDRLGEARQITPLSL